MPKARFVTLFAESVQGLDAGSPVKYKGATIGSVTKVTIRIKDKLIRVDMNINPETLSMETDSYQHWRQQFYTFFRQELKLGLRCRLAYAGITGMKYIDLDYYTRDKTEQSKIKPLLDKGHDFLYIPSQPSVFNDMLTMVSSSLEKISKIKFEKLSNELSATIKALQTLIDNPKLSKTIDQLERTSVNIEKGTAELLTNQLPEVEIFKPERIEHTIKKQPENWGNDIAELETYFVSIELRVRNQKF